jgi:RNA recognition motif-containing protein
MQTPAKPRTFKKPITKQISNKGPTKKRQVNIKNTKKNKNKVFIGGIPPDSNEVELFKFFSEFTQVRDVYVPVHKRTGLVKGFAFVAFKNKQSYELVLKQTKFELKGKTMVARPAVKEEKATELRKEDQKRKLFVKGFESQTSEKEIEDYFGKFGGVLKVLRAMDQEGRFRGFGFVVMKDCESYSAVLEASEQGLLRFKGAKLVATRSKSENRIKKERRKLKKQLHEQRMREQMEAEKEQKLLQAIIPIEGSRKTPEKQTSKMSKSHPIQEERTPEKIVDNPSQGKTKENTTNQVPKKNKLENQQKDNQEEQEPSEEQADKQQISVKANSGNE